MGRRTACRTRNDYATFARRDGNTDAYKQYPPSPAGYGGTGVWDLRYIDAPVLRWRDGNTDGDLDDAEDDTLYYCNDANMNVTAVVDGSDGDVLERYAYDPYGKVTVLNGADGTDPGRRRHDGLRVGPREHLAPPRASPKTRQQGWKRFLTPFLSQQMAAPAIEEFLGGPSWLCMAMLVILSVMASGCVVSPESLAESNGASYELTMQGFVDQAWTIALVQVDNHEDDTWSFRVVKTLKGVMPLACEQWRFDGQGNEDRGRNVLVYGPMRYRAGEDVVPVWLWYTGLNERGYWLRLYPAPDGFWEADVDTRWEELWRWDTPGLIQALQRAREGQRGQEPL